MYALTCNCFVFFSDLFIHRLFSRYANFVSELLLRAYRVSLIYSFTYKNKAVKVNYSIFFYGLIDIVEALSK